MPKEISLENQKFGRLKVIKLDHKQKREDNRSRKYWLCICDCGKYHIVLHENLTMGKTKSCGCLSKEMASIRAKRHSMTGSRIYYIWVGIKQRCYNCKNIEYKNYGGRGIKVCEEWKEDFVSFYNWAMENGYKEDVTIDRIDNNGNYEPSNCRWATKTQQMRNTRKNHLLTYNGKTLCVAEWAEKIGVRKEVLFARIYRGNSVKKSLTMKKDLCTNTRH